MYLKSKFIISQKLFETKVFKILYIRDYYKKIIYDIIKSKADLKALDYYNILEEIIIDLEQNFNNFDKKEKANANL